MAFMITIAPQRYGRRNGEAWCVSMMMLINHKAPSTRVQKPARDVARPYIVVIVVTVIGDTRTSTDYASEAEARAAYLAA